MMRAVVVGAGSIGRGFLAQLFYEAGYALTFIDSDERLVDALNGAGHYELRLVGKGVETIDIAGFRALHTGDIEAVTRAAAEADIACTAAGGGALPNIANLLAPGIAERSEPLNVILCENMPDANIRFLSALKLELARIGSAYKAEAVGGVRAVVSRMTPAAPFATTGSLDLTAEPYRLLPLDAAAMVTSVGLVEGMQPVDRFEAWMARKLFTHNAAHAALGYVGAAHGCIFAADALALRPVRNVVTSVMAETGPALSDLMGFDTGDQIRYENQLLRRFRNRALGDTCARLARSPIRKLAPDDRLIGAVRLCDQAGCDTVALTEVIAMALHWRSDEDPESVELARLIQSIGLTATLARVCGLAADDSLTEAVIYAYERQAGLREADW